MPMVSGKEERTLMFVELKVLALFRCQEIENFNNKNISQRIYMY